MTEDELNRIATRIAITQDQLNRTLLRHNLWHRGNPFGAKADITLGFIMTKDEKKELREDLVDIPSKDLDMLLDLIQQELWDRRKK